MPRPNKYPHLRKASLDAVAQIMDDDIREQVHGELAPCKPGEFLTRYLELDPTFPIHQFDTDR